MSTRTVAVDDASAVEPVVLRRVVGPKSIAIDGP